MNSNTHTQTLVLTTAAELFGVKVFELIQSAALAPGASIASPENVIFQLMLLCEKYPEEIERLEPIAREKIEHYLYSLSIPDIEDTANDFACSLFRWNDDMPEAWIKALNIWQSCVMHYAMEAGNDPKDMAEFITDWRTMFLTAQKEGLNWEDESNRTEALMPIIEKYGANLEVRAIEVLRDLTPYFIKLVNFEGVSYDNITFGIYSIIMAAKDAGLTNHK